MDPGGGIGGRVEVRLLFVLSRVLFFLPQPGPELPRCLGKLPPGRIWMNGASASRDYGEVEPRVFSIHPKIKLTLQKDDYGGDIDRDRGRYM